MMSLLRIYYFTNKRIKKKIGLTTPALACTRDMPSHNIIKIVQKL